METQIRSKWESPFHCQTLDNIVFLGTVGTSSRTPISPVEINPMASSVNHLVKFVLSLKSIITYYSLPFPKHCV